MEQEHSLSDSASPSSHVDSNDPNVQEIALPSDKAQEEESTLENVPVEPKNDIDTANDVALATPGSELNAKLEELQKLLSDKIVNLEELEAKNRVLEEKLSNLNTYCHNLEAKFRLVETKYDLAVKEKESVVVRFAMNEKNVLEQKLAKEKAEKKLIEAKKDSEIMQSKISALLVEKAKLCQMIDSKCIELKTSGQECENLKADIRALETKLKWSQNSLKSELEQHKETNAKLEELSGKIQDYVNQAEQAKKDAQNNINKFRTSQDNRAHVLDQQLQELNAALILERHDRSQKEQHLANCQNEMSILQKKYDASVQENNSLLAKVQQMEKSRIETEQKLSELRFSNDEHLQLKADLNTRLAEIEKLKLQLAHEEDEKESCNQQLTFIKQRNCELESDMESCRARESEMLFFTQQLTDKNVLLQSEFTALETKVQQLSCEHSMSQRSQKEMESKISLLTSQLNQERTQRTEDTQLLAKHLAEKTKQVDQLLQEVEDQKGENLVIKRKLENTIKEVTKELNQCKKKVEQYENLDAGSHSRCSSSSSLSVAEGNNTPSPVHPVNGVNEPPELPVQHFHPETDLDKDTLIKHLIKLQQVSAKKSEKLDFLEEHVQTLVMELQRKTKLIQSFVLKEKGGVLTSNQRDANKAKLAKMNGVMASVFGGRVADTKLTLELSLDINRKLQAVLEDTLLKNITLKENVDTLGAEIERLMKAQKT